MPVAIAYCLANTAPPTRNVGGVVACPVAGKGQSTCFANLSATVSGEKISHLFEIFFLPTISQ